MAPIAAAVHVEIPSSNTNTSVIAMRMGVFNGTFAGIGVGALGQTGLRHDVHLARITVYRLENMDRGKQTDARSIPVRPQGCGISTR